jgi:hypothetical protein
MSKCNSNGQTIGCQRDIGRRKFIGVDMGGAVAAAGIISVVNAARSAARPGRGSFPQHHRTSGKIQANSQVKKQSGP